jgi:hypothetical protein
MLKPKYFQEAGFEGFLPFSRLLAETTLVPTVPGIYVVLRNPNNDPVFLNKSPAGWFKDKNPSVTTDQLASSWVRNAHMLYIGATSRTLRQRVRELVRFGNGANVGHYGGRMLWQLDGIWSAKLAWRQAESEDAGDDKRQLLDLFDGMYGSLPFANINH